MKTTNPFKHRYPHAKLYNVTLTSIKRLSKKGSGIGNHRDHLIENDDPRNFCISNADMCSKLGLDRSTFSA